MTVNGPSHGWVGGKGFCPLKFSPIAVPIMGCGVMDIILCVIHQPRELLAKAGISEACCYFLFWQREWGQAKEEFFHAVKATAFPDRHGKSETSGLQVLMLHLCLCKTSLNEEVQLPALSIQQFACFKHNDRWLELVAKQSSSKSHLQYNKL